MEALKDGVSLDLDLPLLLETAIDLLYEELSNDIHEWYESVDPEVLSERKEEAILRLRLAQLVREQEADGQVKHPSLEEMGWLVKTWGEMTGQINHKEEGHRNE